MTATFHIGCAGWSIPKLFSDDFPRDGSHLQRYSARLNAVEINSSFYRSHRRETYARWADTVPADFRFSVKLPRTITHYARLANCGKLLDGFFDEVGALERKLLCVLIQLPPSLSFDRGATQRFLKMLRRRFDGPCVVEPRHATWFEANASELLEEFDVGRVAADPAIVPAAGQPGGGKTAYFRLHGSPKIYYSNYGSRYLHALTKRLRAAGKTANDVWCIFDNTALGHATGNALAIAVSLRI
jgi:uncharacterized protein YecE (DUF72 family)